jgi:hypothetical protein
MHTNLFLICNLNLYNQLKKLIAGVTSLGFSLRMEGVEFCNHGKMRCDSITYSQTNPIM